MSDVQSVAYHEYITYSESRGLTRTPPRLEPKLRGWRINRSDQAEKLAQLLRKHARRSLNDAMDYTEYAGYRAAQHQDRGKQLRKEFAQHARKWKAETGFLSSIHQITVHPSYLRIIGMGRATIP